MEKYVFSSKIFMSSWSSILCSCHVSVSFFRDFVLKNVCSDIQSLIYRCLMGSEFPITEQIQVNQVWTNIENITLTSVSKKQRSYQLSCLIKTLKMFTLLQILYANYYLIAFTIIEFAWNDFTAKSKINGKIIGNSFNRNCLKYDSILFLDWIIRKDFQSKSCFKFLRECLLKRSIIIVPPNI